jgi:uncharacterized repeat protein (TIGR03803 family)
MKSTVGFRIFGALAGLLVTCAGVAQSYEILHAFGDGQYSSLSGLTRTPDGRLWGTTSIGGKFGKGSVFALTPDGLGGYVYEEIHAFRGPDGMEPSSQLLLASNGSLYGTTVTGGSSFQGTVFRIDRGDRVTTIHSFDGTDGAGPSGSLIQASDGFFYGLTVTGSGNLNGGGFFRMDADGNVTVLHAFVPPDGRAPRDSLVQGIDGGFYGVTSEGGNDFYNVGTVFRVDTAGNLTTLHEFGMVDGANPHGGLVLAYDGNLYGTTLSGAGNSGVFFRISNSAFQLLHEFDSSEGGGSRSRLLRGSDGFLYGTNGAYQGGSLYRMDLAGNFVAVKRFEMGDGTISSASPVEDPAGGFFAVGLAPEGHGAVLHISDAGVVANVHELLGEDGIHPIAKLLEASDGGIYGVTNGGGDHGRGVIYRMDLSGAYDIVHRFTPEDGGNQAHGLTQASDSHLYGTTLVGGHLGTAYRLGLDGTFETLCDFPGTPGGELPMSGLTETPAGDFLGVSLGGASSNGLLYRMESDGVVTPVYDFPGIPGPFWPQDELILADDGNFYGVSGGGPSPGYGIVYRLDGTDNVTPLHEFDGGNGSSPSGPLLQASDGKLYGAANILFRVDLSGNFEPFHTFSSGAEGEAPLGGLVESNGYLYGATAQGGAFQGGAIYRIDLEGEVESLWPFNFERGLFPNGPVLMGSDGDLYGTTSNAGPAGDHGVLFRYSFDTNTPVVDGITPTSGRAAGGTSVVVKGSHIPPGPGMQFGSTMAVGVTGLDAATVFALSPALPPGTLHDISLPIPVQQGGATSAPVAFLPEAWFADFLDVSSIHPFHDFVESIVRAGITAGCGSGNYCPANPVTRAQMAVFLLKAKHGSAYVPPGCAGIFSDVPCPSQFADWIEQLSAEGVTSGCGTGVYCPGNPVTRAQMAVFLLKTDEGSSYTPPPATGVFGDVPVGSFADAWIEEIYARGITGGCSASPLLYCPAGANTRGQMAVFLVKTFGL